MPQGHPPSVSWRLCADLISPWLCDVLHKHWVTPALQVPRAWTDVDLALVPKPDRTGRNPQDHRPIGLACPLGKKFLGALLQPHVPGIIEQIKRFPQFAYQQGRSQFAALRRVYQHCSSVREQLQKHTRNLHQRFAGTKAVPLYGALMLTVDLAQAFDRMPRSKLYQGLCRLQLPQDLIHILMAWHSSIHYHIHHHQNTSSFRASQGIRQGCSVAPLLWLVFTHEVCCALADKVGEHTLLRILTMFADDFLLADSFTSLAELEHLLDIIAVLFKTLEAFGMQVSAQKSKAILVLRGTLRNSVHKKFVRPDPSGEGMALRMHTSGGVLNVPLTDCFTYLGARVSYSHFERQTLEWRLSKGEAAFQRLGKVLKGRHHLTAHQRLRLWQACVWTTTQYGLIASGLPPAGIQRLETFVVRQLRAVLRLPAHITRTTNEEVCSAAQFPLPHVALQTLLNAEGARLSVAPADPFVCAPADPWWKQIHSTLNIQVQHGITQLDPELCEAQTCPHCGITYHTRAALKTHLAKQHQDLHGETAGAHRPCFSKTADSQGGLPQCRHCYKNFPTWQLLERHITGGYCRVKPSPTPGIADVEELSLQHGPSVVADVKLAHHPDLLKAFSTYQVNAVLHFSERRKYLQRCLLCGQWVASPAVIKTHYKGSHPQAFKLSSQATKLCSSFSSAGSPCLYCGTCTKQPRHHKQQCSVLWQFCLLAANRGDADLPGQAIPVAPHGGDQSRTGAQGTLWSPGELPSGCVRASPAGLRQLDARNGATQGPTTGQREAGTNPRKQPTLASFWARRQQTEGGSKGDRQHQALIKAMARLIIRQETSIQILKQNSAWDVYLQPGQQGPLPMLFRASEEYRKEAKNKRMDCPLRAQLLQTLFQTMLTCITNLKDNAGQTQAAQARGWLTPEGRWVYQLWDQQTQALTVDSSRQPLDFQELLILLSAMAQAVRRKDVVHRFNATHQLAADQRGTARFMLEIGLRAEGVADVWKGLEALQGLAALQIVGMQLRRDGLRRSNLAEDVQRMLGEL